LVIDPSRHVRVLFAERRPRLDPFAKPLFEDPGDRLNTGLVARKRFCLNHKYLLPLGSTSPLHWPRAIPSRHEICVALERFSDLDRVKVRRQVAQIDLISQFGERVGQSLSRGSGLEIVGFKRLTAWGIGTAAWISMPQSAEATINLAT